MPYAKSETSAARILDAALGLFRTKGFDESTMRDIAAAAGMATTTDAATAVTAAGTAATAVTVAAPDATARPQLRCLLSRARS